ncbi:10454_t:CDS:1 [Acaulospora colombiana]|uniref:10454_t:CDS:1 n=1 Tax=Acaulospora colombiana TaxID=27376 RepID=A0ACA9KH73_9GLOM|nr:10454_t:CDS:1 [Acaulospora colombiana]
MNIPIDESEDYGSDIEVENDDEVVYEKEEPYSLKVVEFAPDYVGEKVTEKLKTSILDRLRTELEPNLTAGTNNPNLGSFFEQSAHKMLSPIKIIDLIKLSDKLARTDEISFYFVVPAELYNNYQNLKFVTNNNANIRSILGWIRNRVKQYSLRIDLSSESLSSGSKFTKKK